MPIEIHIHQEPIILTSKRYEIVSRTKDDLNTSHHHTITYGDSYNRAKEDYDQKVKSGEYNNVSLNIILENHVDMSPRPQDEKGGKK